MLQDSLGNHTNVHTELQPSKHITFNDLPIEIIISIFAYVTPLDLKDLRLVCRKWNDAASDKETWIKAFDNRLGTGKIFASATRSSIWISEYFGRIALLRKWAKAKAHSRSYQVVNDHHIDQVEVDFTNDRLLLFSQFGGSITSCTLSSGKNQLFIPESDVYSQIIAFDISWKHSCVANTSGELYLKNLITATSTGYNQSSVRRLIQHDYPTVAVKINRCPDKHKEKSDIVSISQEGLLSFWNIAGVLNSSLELKDEVLDLRTDFSSLVVVVSKQSLYIIDFKTVQIAAVTKHGFNFTSNPRSFEVDFHDSNIVLSDRANFKVFHYANKSFHFSQGHAPGNTFIIRGTMQKSSHQKNPNLAGGDGLLYALTFTDGSVGICNIRDIQGNISFNTRIMPFKDDRTPQGLEEYTVVALNSTVIAIGAVADFVHFYDAHSGKYLREGTKVSRKFTRFGRTTISKIELGPTGTCGVIVSDDSIQYFRFGDEAIAQKKPNAPQAVNLNNKRALSQHIKSQMADYNELEYQKLQRDILIDKYNGVKFDDEQDELRVALALSASYAANNELNTVPGYGSDEDLAKALELSERDSKLYSPPGEIDADLKRALRQSELEYHKDIYTSGASNEGSSRIHNSNDYCERPTEDSEDEMLRRVLELSMIDH